MKKIDSFRHFNKKNSVNEYSQMYKKLTFDIKYPANVKREEIFVNLLKKHKPKKIVDAGCGAGMPLIDIKKRGFNIIGYDKATNMSNEHIDNFYSDWKQNYSKISVKQYRLLLSGRG